MGGIRNLCKMYGRIKLGSTMWVWDYHNDEPVEESKMTKDQFALSEKAKWAIIKDQEDKQQKQK